MNSQSLITDLSTVTVVMQMVSAAVYLGAGVAALAEAPRDERTRVFFGLALTSLAATGVIVWLWVLGVKDDMAFGRLPFAVWLAAVAVAALSLFHFSQVFPRRRPWRAESGVQLPIAYLLAPIAVIAMVKLAPEQAADPSPAFIALGLVFGFPLVVLFAFVLPVATIVSLARSYREASGTADLARARRPLAGLLISTLAAAAVGFLVQSPLQAAAPDSIAAVIAEAVVWMLGMVTPLAYAVGIWRYRVLQIPL